MTPIEFYLNEIRTLFESRHKVTAKWEKLRTKFLIESNISILKDKYNYKSDGK